MKPRHMKIWKIHKYMDITQYFLKQLINNRRKQKKMKTNETKCSITKDMKCSKCRNTGNFVAINAYTKKRKKNLQINLKK
jgi:hypothetical protein